MKKSILITLITLLLVLFVASIAQAEKPLHCTIEYTFIGAVDGQGRFIAWEGPISGDINGWIRWYAGSDPMRFTGQASHYADFWEIVDNPQDNNFMLGGADQTGSTTVRHGKNSTWRTNGVITDANDAYAHLIGRHVHQSGHFTWLDPNTPEAGDGIFRVN